MSEKTLNTRIQYLYDTLENWTAVGEDLILLSGEIAIVSDYNQMKVGDGETAFNALPYVNFKETIIKPTINTSTTLTYDGNVKCPTIDNFEADKMIIGGTLSAIDAGTYYVHITPKQAYCWNDLGECETVTLEWKIEKATPTITVSEEEVTLSLLNKEATILLSVEGDNEIYSMLPAGSGVFATGAQLTFDAASYIDYKIFDNKLHIVAKDYKLPNGFKNAAISMILLAHPSHNYTQATLRTITVHFNFPSTTLEYNSWDMIDLVSSLDLGQNYWNVGDTKSVVLNGSITSSYGTFSINSSSYPTPFLVYIIGFNHNVNIEGRGIHFAGFKLSQNLSEIGYQDVPVAIYNENVIKNDDKPTTNDVSNWYSSILRSMLNRAAGSLYTMLPKSLRNVLKNTRKSYYTDYIKYADDTPSFSTDKINIPSLTELGESRLVIPPSNITVFEEAYAYFAQGNKQRVRIYNDTSNYCYIWTRDIYTDYNSTLNQIDFEETTYKYRSAFKYTMSSGSVITISGINYAGIMPIFKI